MIQFAAAPHASARSETWAVTATENTEDPVLVWLCNTKEEAEAEASRLGRIQAIVNPAPEVDPN